MWESPLSHRPPPTLAMDQSRICLEAQARSCVATSATVTVRRRYSNGLEHHSSRASSRRLVIRVCDPNVRLHLTPASINLWRITDCGCLLHTSTHVYRK